MIFTETYTLITCYKCGIDFAAPDHWVKTRHNDHASFFCPNGHSQYFAQKSDAEIERDRRLKAEAQRARAEDRAEVAERRRRAEKGAKTRILNRIQNGVCPHCKRTFTDLARHMETKHATG